MEEKKSKKRVVVTRYLVNGDLFFCNKSFSGFDGGSAIPFPIPNLQIFYLTFLFFVSLWNSISLVFSVSVSVSSHCSMVDSLILSLQLIPSSSFFFFFFFKLILLQISLFTITYYSQVIIQSMVFAGIMAVESSNSSRLI